MAGLDPAIHVFVAMPKVKTWMARFNRAMTRKRNQVIRLLRRTLGEDALEGAAVHVEAAGCLGDVAVAKLIDALNMFPAYTVCRHGVLWRIGLVAACRQK